MMLMSLLLAACTAATAFIGTVCTPEGAGKHPAIMLLGGSEGGDHMARVAARFAEHGYVGVSVAYFGLPALPGSLENIPLETFGKALDAVMKRPDVEGARIALMGYSKGGEFALLAASHYPQIHAVIAGVPSPFAWQGIPQGFSPPLSSWTIAGKPVPYVAYSSVMGADFGNAFATHKPIRLEHGYHASMQENTAAIPAAMFPLEKIAGPVLLLAAGDDGVWDSQAQSEMALQYLRDHHHAYADELKTYDGAGHMFLFSSPDHPFTQAPAGPITMDMGGTAKANDDARTDAWKRIDAFLTAALK